MYNRLNLTSITYGVVSYHHGGDFPPPHVDCNRPVRQTPEQAGFFPVAFIVSNFCLGEPEVLKERVGPLGDGQLERWMPCFKNGTPLGSGIVEEACLIRPGEPSRIPKELLHKSVEEEDWNLLLAMGCSNNPGQVKVSANCRDESI
jgi:hypothetical protein